MKYGLTVMPIYIKSGKSSEYVTTVWKRAKDIHFLFYFESHIFSHATCGLVASFRNDVVASVKKKVIHFEPIQHAGMFLTLETHTLRS